MTDTQNDLDRAVELLQFVIAECEDLLHDRYRGGEGRLLDSRLTRLATAKRFASEHPPLTSQRCMKCNGSGEGRYDGTYCPPCKGSGEVQV